MRRLLAACLFAATVAACSLFTSLDGYSGAPPSSTEGGIDSPATTGGDAGDGGLTSFCATQTDAQLCESFDDKPLPGAFDERTASGATTFLDSTLSASPMRSLSVTLAPETTTLEHYGGVVKVLPPGVSRVTMNAKVHVAKVPTVSNNGPRADMFGLYCGNTSGGSAFSTIVMIRPSPAGDGADVWLTTFTSDTGSADYVTPFTKIPLGAWQELRFMTDWTTLEVSLEAIDASGAVLLGSAALNPPANVTLPPPYCEMVVGLYSNQANDGWSARFDDVVLRTR